MSKLICIAPGDLQKSLCCCACLAISMAVSADPIVKVIHNSAFTTSAFAKAVGINQVNFLWPIERCPELFSEVTKVQRVGFESVLSWNALKNSGFKGQIQFIPAGNSKRQKVELAKGNADFIGHTLFCVSVEASQQFSAASFLITTPVIKAGQSIAGIFTIANQREA
ncbi:MAG: hypothetical protein MJK13_16085, partial [Pseudomonadales bacterium]|nr:hypothetical protein [Pseudomonadales bacterium]